MFTDLPTRVLPRPRVALCSTASTHGNDYSPTACEATEQNKRENIYFTYDKGQDRVSDRTLFKENTAKS